MKRFILFATIYLTVLSSILAWTYPEHRRITLIALQKLNSSYRSELDSLWILARKGYESRLDATVADFSLGLKPAYIDYAAWPAVGGDHSSSPAEMLHVIPLLCFV